MITGLNLEIFKYICFISDFPSDSLTYCFHNKNIPIFHVMRMIFIASVIEHTHFVCSANNLFYIFNITLPPFFKFNLHTGFAIVAGFYFRTLTWSHYKFNIPTNTQINVISRLTPQTCSVIFSTQQFCKEY